jgi:hypothetical protein
MNENPLDNLIALCKHLDEFENRRDRLEEELKYVEQRIKDLSTRSIPDLMRAVNLTELRLTDGQRISVRPDIVASVSKERMPQVLAWLQAHNAQAIAKQKLVVDINDLPKETVIAMENAAIALGAKPTMDASIHPSTLRAFVKEQLEQGTPDFPRELFGVHEGSKAVITTGR